MMTESLSAGPTGCFLALSISVKQREGEREGKIENTFKSVSNISPNIFCVSSARPSQMKYILL